MLTRVRIVWVNQEQQNNLTNVGDHPNKSHHSFDSSRNQHGVKRDDSQSAQQVEKLNQPNAAEDDLKGAFV
jgi:uncharacterized protein (DUF1778 family)